MQLRSILDKVSKKLQLRVDHDQKLYRKHSSFEAL